MTTTNLNVRIDENLRNQVTQVLASYGLSPNQAIKLFFNQVVSTGKVPLSFDWADTTPPKLSENGERLLRESVAEFENGEYTRTSFDDFAQWAKDNA